VGAVCQKKKDAKRTKKRTGQEGEGGEGKRVRKKTKEKKKKKKKVSKKLPAHGAAQERGGPKGGHPPLAEGFQPRAKSGEERKEGEVERGIRGEYGRESTTTHPDLNTHPHHNTKQQE